jgi:hypothetical protein
MSRSAVAGQSKREAIGGQPRPRRRHEAAVLDAQVRLSERELAPFGVLTREELADRADASLWHSGTFEGALRAGARRRLIRLLPGGFVAPHRHRSPGLGVRARAAARRRPGVASGR